MRKSIILGFSLIILSLFIATSVKWLKYDNDKPVIESTIIYEDIPAEKVKKLLPSPYYDAAKSYATSKEVRYKKIATSFLCYEYVTIDSTIKPLITKP